MISNISTKEVMPNENTLISLSSQGFTIVNVKFYEVSFKKDNIDCVFTVPIPTGLLEDEFYDFNGYIKYLCEGYRDK